MATASTVITIDGPAGSGKSTSARRLAERLGFQFLDTGAMYRVVAWKCLDMGVALSDETRVGKLAAAIEIRFEQGRVLADNRDVTELIRTPEVTDGSSVVAANPRVREEMGRLQRAAARGMNIVTEGRDQGTVVFPDAACKFFLTADEGTRARRRQSEMQRRGSSASLDEIQQQIAERDQRDEQRSVAPLRAADDAITIDTSSLSIEQVVDALERRCLARLGNSGRQH